MDAANEQDYKDAINKYNGTFKTNVQSLRDLQLTTLNAILIQQKDCICALPTGYGKSLVYELIPFIEIGSLIIIIVPLNVIMEQQLTKLGEHATSLAPEKLDLKKLKSGQLNYIFAHPEQILNNETLFELFSTDVFTARKTFLVVDEAHCILEWGQTFRKDFKELSQLRAIFQECKVLALSATVTKESAKKIAEGLLMVDYEIVSGCPAKDNIVIAVQRRPSPTAKGNTAQTPYNYVFDPLIRQLYEEQQSFPITIVYCKSMQWLGHGWEMAKRILGPAFWEGEPSPETARVVQFHSSMEKEPGNLKKLILTSLQKADQECHIRLIFASVALGMGADLMNVKRIVHAGPPTTLETYVQEIGRAGRTGCTAEAILFFNNTDIAQSAIHKDVKNFCNDTVRCRREIINSYFGFQTPVRPQPCCNYCDTHIELSCDFSKLSLK